MVNEEKWSKYPAICKGCKHMFDCDKKEVQTCIEIEESKKE
jgi:hypothetical protein